MISMSRVTRETLHGTVIYPKELPCARGRMVEYSMVIIIILIIALCLGEAAYNGTNAVSFFIGLVSYLTVLILLEFFKRLLYSIEELKHLKSRHKGNMWHLTKKMLDFTSFAKILILATVCSHLPIKCLNIGYLLHIHNLSLWQYFGIITICNLLQDLTLLSRNPVFNAIFLKTVEGLECGSAMAQNFFYGYLRLCLPNTGTQEKGIVERIEDFISKQGLPENLFPVKRLFILIPASSYVPDDLKECSFGWMKSVGTLEKVVKDRAGCKDRVYKNTVYKIKNPDDDLDDGVYVVAEGATPCKTFFESVEYSGMKQDFYKEYQKEIIFNFFETLRTLLRENRNCRGLCNIIYYVDTDEFGLNNVNVGKLILQQIEEIQQEEELLNQIR